MDANSRWSVESKKDGQDAATVLTVTGSLDFLSAPALTEALDEGMTGGGRIILNLSGLAALDVEGAGALLAGAARACRRGIAVSAWGLSLPMRDAFHLAGLDSLISLAADEEAALRAPIHPERDDPETSIFSAVQPSPGWAGSGSVLSVAGIPADMMNINVEGRRAAGPVAGFGRLWEKKYRLRLGNPSLEPRQISSLWRSEFPAFWPKGNRLCTSGNAPLEPGVAGLINLTLPGGLVLATGVLVMHVAETSFSFMTTQGHILSGWITFSSFREGNAVFIQVHPLFRAGDPLMELSLRFGGAAQEDRFWHETLGNLARRLGTDGEVVQQNILVDPGFQWSRFTNLRHSAAIGSTLFMPFYLLKKLLAA